MMRDPVRLSSARRYTLYAVGLGLWLSGALWLVFHYFMARKGDFGPTPHPLEFWWRAAHGLFAFLSLALVGFLWAAHFIGAWKSGRHRVTGIVLSVLLGWLIVSGYLLYYLGEDDIVDRVALLHWSVGLALPAFFLLHRYWSRLW